MFSQKSPPRSAPPPGYGQPPAPPFSRGVSGSPLMPQTVWSSGLCDCCLDIPNCKSCIQIIKSSYVYVRTCFNHKKLLPLLKHRLLNILVPLHYFWTNS